MCRAFFNCNVIFIIRKTDFKWIIKGYGYTKILNTIFIKLWVAIGSNTILQVINSWLERGLLFLELISKMQLWDQQFIFKTILKIGRFLTYIWRYDFSRSGDFSISHIFNHCMTKYLNLLDF